MDKKLLHVYAVGVGGLKAQNAEMQKCKFKTSEFVTAEYASMFEHLKRLTGWTKDLPAHQVQGLSAAAEAAGAAPRAMSGLGAGGRHAGNSDRDLRRAVRRTKLFGLEPSAVLIPVRNRRGHGHKLVRWPVLLPHEFFAALHDAGRMDVFTGTDNGAVAAFWSGVKEERWCRVHPAHADPTALPWTIPVRIHGDEGTGHKKQPTMIISWGSAVAHGESQLTRLLFTVVPARAYVTQKKST